MSSGFVSGGSLEKPVERDDEWRRAQQELAEERARKDALSQQNDGKSLFEVLQANKAAKQDAFEEAAKFKNQYRALDDEEAEFVNAVLEQTRKKEAEVKRDTLEQLHVFRKRQEETERKALEEANTAGSPPVEAAAAQWVAPAGRKRKKEHKEGGLLKGVKLRRASSSLDAAEAKKATPGEDEANRPIRPASPAATTKAQFPQHSNGKAAGSPVESPERPKAATAAPQKPLPLSLSLGYASSDEDD